MRVTLILLPELLLLLLLSVLQAVGYSDSGTRGEHGGCSGARTAREHCAVNNDGVVVMVVVMRCGASWHMMLLPPALQRLWWSGWVLQVLDIVWCGLGH